MQNLKKYWIFGSVSLTLLILLLWGGSLYHRWQHTRNLALEQARYFLDKDQALRAWVAEQGGVYVKTSPQVEPNPYLKFHAKRDLRVQGMNLTLVNPAYFMRLLYQAAQGQFGPKSHLTSLKPLNSINQPDEWEKQGLLELEKGKKKEWIGFVDFEGKPYLRVIRALRVKQPCMRCHAAQGYQVGDLRGGLTINLPMQPFLAEQLNTFRIEAFTTLLLWAIALLGLRQTLLWMKRDQQKISNLADRLQAVTDSMGEGVLVQNSSDRITLANPKVERLFGWKEEELLDKHPCFIFHAHPENPETLCEQCRQREKEGRIDTEFTESLYRHQTGEWIPVSILTTPLIHHQAHGGCVTVIRDIRKQKELETQLKQAKELSEKTSQIKTNFLNIVGHELRTPLHGIMGMTAVMYDEITDSQLREHVQVVQESGKNLLQIVNNIFDFSRLEAAQLTAREEKFSIQQVLTNLLQLFRASAELKGLKLEVNLSDSLPAYNLGDGEILQRILSQLLSNAIKFSPQGTVTLSALPLEGQENWTRFEVCDEGIGISEEQKTKIYSKFTQVDDSYSRSYSGMGIGLTLVDRLVRLLKGRHGVQSEVGQGSCFWLEAPLPSTTQPWEIEQGPSLQSRKIQAQTSSPKPRILLVDDNPINQRMMSKYLEKLGIEADEVPSGKIALEYLKKQDYGLIFMDCAMPDMNGFQCARLIRAMEKAEELKGHIAIVALTAWVDEENIEQCKEAGMDDYIGKPMDLTHAKAVIEKFLGPI